MKRYNALHNATAQLEKYSQYSDRLTFLSPNPSPAPRIIILNLAFIFMHFFNFYYLGFYLLVLSSIILCVFKPDINVSSCLHSAVIYITPHCEINFCWFKWLPSIISQAVVSSWWICRELLFFLPLQILLLEHSLHTSLCTYVAYFQLTYLGVELLSCGFGFTYLYLPGLPRTAMHNFAICFRLFFQTGCIASRASESWPTLGFVRCLNIVHWWVWNTLINYGFNLHSPDYWWGQDIF